MRKRVRTRSRTRRVSLVGGRPSRRSVKRLRRRVSERQVAQEEKSPQVPVWGTAGSFLALRDGRGRLHEVGADGFAAGEADLELVPVRDRGLAEAPAEPDAAAVIDGGEVHEAGTPILENAADLEEFAV